MIRRHMNNVNVKMVARLFIKTLLTDRHLVNTHSTKRDFLTSDVTSMLCLPTPFVFLIKCSLAINAQNPVINNLAYLTRHSH
jgi:hypothetical protein